MTTNKPENKWASTQDKCITCKISLNHTSPDMNILFQNLSDGQDSSPVAADWGGEFFLAGVKANSSCGVLAPVSILFLPWRSIK